MKRTGKNPPAKWLLKGKTQSPAQRRAYWEQNHEDGYKDVFSVTEDPALRAYIVDALADLPSHQKILIPGCGSKGLLEQSIAVSLPGCQHVLCTDFAKVVGIPAAANKNALIEYRGIDSGKLDMKGQFDAIVVVNSILSDNDSENRKILKSCLKALKPGGSLIGFFPTVFCALDFAITSKLPEWKSYLQNNVDLETQSEHEEPQNVRQTFYSPLLLNQILKEAGFKDRKMGVYFFDSAFFHRQSQALYGITDTDLTVYEFFVTAKRPLAPRPS